MVKFQSIAREEKIKILLDAGDRMNLPAYVIEKDWWVVQTLAILFEMEIGKHMVFKGGTSLSKAWGLINRFSEDIDLAVDRKFYGFDGELGKKQRTNLRKKANNYITERLYPELNHRFRVKGLDVEVRLEEIITSDQDPIIIFINYPYLLESSGYLKPQVQVELGCRSLIEPFTMRPICSMLDETYPESSFAEPPIYIPAVDPVRTLLEKIFLLHEEFQRPSEKIRVDRMSRHLFDIYKLIEAPAGEQALQNKQLYTEIVKHRQSFTKLGGVDYNLHNPATINPLPPIQLFEAWKKDYISMQESMFGSDAPDFEDILKKINVYKQKMNNLNWQF